MSRREIRVVRPTCESDRQFPPNWRLTRCYPDIPWAIIITIINLVTIKTHRTKYNRPQKRARLYSYKIHTLQFLFQPRTHTDTHTQNTYAIRNKGENSINNRILLCTVVLIKVTHTHAQTKENPIKKYQR